jgi:hypothetical protein
MFVIKEMGYILGMVFIIVFFYVIGIQLKANSCKPAILHIKNLAVCKTHGIDKNECEIAVKYCGSDEYFVKVKRNKQGEELEERINKNVVSYIEFKD